MRTDLAPPGSLTKVALLAGRELRFRLGSAWFWAVSSATCLMAFLYGSGFQASFRTESVLVTADPLLALDTAVVVFLAVVLGLRLAAAMAWEREHRTLEVLLTGPAGWGVIIAARFLVEGVVLALLVALYGAYLVIAQPLGAGVVGVAELRGLIIVPVFALPVMATGLLVGAGLGSVRAAVVAFLVLIGLMAAVEITRGVLSVQTADQMTLAALYLRRGLDLAAPVLDLVSPVARLGMPIRSLAHQIPLEAGAALHAMAEAGVLAGLACLVGRVRGALR